MHPPPTGRQKLPWYPKIDEHRCKKDLGCMIFCEHGVFEWDAAGRRPVVAHPDNCVPGCDACASQCKMKAITLPTREEFRAALRRMRRQLSPLIGGT